MERNTLIRRGRTLFSFLLLALLLFSACSAPEPSYAPPSAAGNLVVYSVYPCEDLLAPFSSLYPNVKVDFHQFASGEALAQQLEEDMRNKQSPDVLIGIPRLDGLDVTNYMRNDYFLPLTQHLQNDPTFDDLQYESNILHAGAYQGTQYVLPFLFSLKVLITQEDAFTESELSMWGHYSGGEIYADLANYFTDFQPLTYETPLSALGIADEFSYATEFLSAGLDLNNPSFAATSLDERFVRYLLLYRPFLKKAAEASAGTPERELQQTCDISAYMYYPSFLSIEKLAAVQQYYDHKEQSCIFIPMPKMTEGNVYPAVVELYGCVLKESHNPKAAY